MRLRVCMFSHFCDYTFLRVHVLRFAKTPLSLQVFFKNKEPLCQTPKFVSLMMIAKC
jgi:hypothetical protein